MQSLRDWRTRGAPSPGDNGTVTPGRIDLEDLSHHFIDRKTGESVHAVDGVSLSVKAGEFVTIVGPSGCGKSTILKIMAGLTRPTGGRVLCDERPVSGPGRDRGVVFQELAVLPWRTVRRNIAHGLEIQRVPKREREERVAYFMDLMGLTEFAHHYPHQLSGGMKQRVAVARTWAAEPNVILMDEPFAAVDAQTRMTLQSELLRISSVRNSTIVFITHNVDEAVILGDRVVVMSRRPGQIKEIVDVPVPREERQVTDLVQSPSLARVIEQVLRLVREEV